MPSRRGVNRLIMYTFSSETKQQTQICAQAKMCVPLWWDETRNNYICWKYHELKGNNNAFFSEWGHSNTRVILQQQSVCEHSAAFCCWFIATLESRHLLQPFNGWQMWIIFNCFLYYCVQTQESRFKSFKPELANRKKDLHCCFWFASSLANIYTSQQFQCFVKTWAIKIGLQRHI